MNAHDWDRWAMIVVGWVCGVPLFIPSHFADGSMRAALYLLFKYSTHINLQWLYSRLFFSILLWFFDVQADKGISIPCVLQYVYDCICSSVPMFIMAYVYAYGLERHLEI